MAEVVVANAAEAATAEPFKNATAFAESAVAEAVIKATAAPGGAAASSAAAAATTAYG